MEISKACPEYTTVYISGPELRAAWDLMEERQLNSLSWAVRLLVRGGIKALDDPQTEETDGNAPEEI